MSGWEFLLTIGASILTVSMQMGIEHFDRKRSRDKRRTQLISEVRAAILASQPTWDQLVDMADLESSGVGDVIFCVRALYKRILTGTEQEIRPYKSLLEDYIARYKVTDPFEGLPAETRIHMERLHEAMKGHEMLLEPLTGQIRELVSVYERDKRAQKRYTVGGFLIGLLSLVFAAYAYYYPITNVGSTEHEIQRNSPSLDRK